VEFVPNQGMAWRPLKAKNNTALAIGSDFAVKRKIGVLWRDLPTPGWPGTGWLGPGSGRTRYSSPWSSNSH